jgi:hypothetical protein
MDSKNYPATLAIYCGKPVININSNETCRKPTLWQPIQHRAINGTGLKSQIKKIRK